MSTDFNFLTSKQKKVYSAIEAFIKSKGIPPTVREIGIMVGEKTPGAVQGILNRLEQKGVIKRQLGMARSIQLVSTDSKYAEHTYLPKINKISKRNIDDLFNLYNVTKYYPLPSHLVDSKSNCFIINCPDNSLLDSGIGYEDTLIIDMEAELRNGDIVLVMYDRHVLLRYYEKHENENNVILKADSDIFDKEIFNINEIEIIGKLVYKFTQYK
jgi:repressor LexA